MVLSLNYSKPCTVLALEWHGTCTVLAWYLHGTSRYSHGMARHCPVVAWLFPFAPHSNINSHSGESPSPPAHCLLENGIDTWATPTTMEVPWCVTPSTPLLAHLHTDHQGQVKKHMPASTN